MGWSSRLFLISADDVLHRLASTAFGRMLRSDSRCRAPDFAGQRVRLVGVTVELADGVALGVRHMGFSMLDFDARGVPDIRRLNAQQIARLDAMLARTLMVSAPDAPVVEASSRFVARGGTWEPSAKLSRLIEATALLQLPCGRVRVTG